MKKNLIPQESSEAGGFLKKLLGFSLASYLGALITFAATYINTRIYDTATMGKINLFFTVQTFLLYIAYFGVDQSYCRYYYEYNPSEEKKHLFDVCISISLYVTILLAVLVFLGWRPLSQYIAGDYSLQVVVALVISIIAMVAWRYLTLLERMQHHILLYTILMVLHSITTKLSFTSISWLTMDVGTSTMAIGVSILLVTVTFYCVRKQKPSMLNVRLLVRDSMAGRVFKFGLPLMPVSLVSWVNSSIPVLLLRKFTDYDTVGIYTNAVVLVSIINLVQGGFNTFWVPYYYENYKTGSNRIRRVHDVVCVVMVAFAVALILCKDLIFMILGSDYRSGAIAFALMLISPVCYTIGETTGIGIGISEKSYLNTIIYTCGAILNFLISLILIPIMGIIGAAIAVAISSCTTLVMKTIIGERYYQVVNSKARTSLALCFLVISAVVDYVVSGAVREILLIIVLLLLLIIYKKDVIFCYESIRTTISKRLKNDSR